MKSSSAKYEALKKSKFHQKHRNDFETMVNTLSKNDIECYVIWASIKKSSNGTWLVRRDPRAAEKQLMAIDKWSSISVLWSKTVKLFLILAQSTQKLYRLLFFFLPKRFVDVNIQHLHHRLDIVNRLLYESNTTIHRIAWQQFGFQLFYRRRAREREIVFGVLLPEKSCCTTIICQKRFNVGLTSVLALFVR